MLTMSKQKLRPTPHQLEMLTFLDREGGPVQEQELNGRVAKALLARGWARHDNVGVEINESGRDILRKFLPWEATLEGAAAVP